MPNLILFLFLFLFSHIVSAISLENIVVFGDSLSDNGNLYEYMHRQLPASPPYYKGRFSNGPIWVEKLAHSYFPDATRDHLLDYAFGGAGISENPDDDDVLFTLKREVQTYLLAHQDKANPNSLFIVWIGANNYLAIPALDNIEAITAEVNEGIQHGLERLVQAGAKHILILNLPDLGKAPVARLFSAETLLTEYTQKHNTKLLALFDDLRQRYPSIQWLYYDTNNALNKILENPVQYGFTNIRDTCYEVGADIFKNKNQHAILDMASRVMNHSSQKKCDGYVFFDPVHPTSKVHQLVAMNIRELLDQEDLNLIPSSQKNATKE